MASLQAKKEALARKKAELAQKKADLAAKAGGLQQAGQAQYNQWSEQGYGGDEASGGASGDDAKSAGWQ